MNAFYFYLFIFLHPYIAQWHKSFVQAGRASWEALIPGYNYFVAFKLSCHKPWWSLLLLFPGVHLIMWAVVNTSYIRRFGYYSLSDTLQGIFFPYLIMHKIASSQQAILPETNWANGKEAHEREMGDHLVLFLSLPIFGHALAFIFKAISREKPGNKTKVKEWGDSLIFALIAASIIRTYVFEPFKIPTGSMEKTLLVGDFLFVNKLAYGPKAPVTPLSFPLVHNTFPVITMRSYSYFETLKYTRLPGFSPVKRNDVMVFNYPSGDTAVYDPRMPEGLMGHDYYGILLREAERLWQENELQSLVSQRTTFYMDSITKVVTAEGKTVNIEGARSWARGEAFTYAKEKFGVLFINDIEKWKSKARKMIAEDKVTVDNSGVEIHHHGLIYRPVDKRENYIKRCVAIPGDVIEIKSSILYVNGKKAFVAPNQNLKYIVSQVESINEQRMYDLGIEAKRGDYRQMTEDTWEMTLTQSQLDQVKKDINFRNATFKLVLMPQYSDTTKAAPTGSQMVENLQLFPKDPYINNTVTDFTKFQIPAKGQTVKITAANIAWYRRIITAYEGHTLKETKNGIFIDGKKVNSYTFAMNYYWLMGDNRYNSADSRFWGCVPEDHVVGKASMVWYSSDPYGGVRTDRIFKLIH